jgi:hypothetical protein
MGVLRDLTRLEQLLLALPTKYSSLQPLTQHTCADSCVLLLLWRLNTQSTSLRPSASASQSVTSAVSNCMTLCTSIRAHVRVLYSTPPSRLISLIGAAVSRRWKQSVSRR